MANESERGNFIGVTDEISDALAAALVQKVVVLPLIYSEDIPQGTNVKKFRQDGSLTAATVAESTAYTFGAGSEVTQTSQTATATKKMVSSKLTDEAMRFRNEDEITIATRQGAAIGRALDDEVKALFSGFSNQITATSILTVDDIFDAAYTVNAALAASEDTLVGVFDKKGMTEIRKEVAASSGAVYSNTAMSTLVQELLLEDVDKPAGYVAHLGGVDCYETTGLPTDSSDDVALVFSPSNALAGIYDTGINTWAIPKGSEGVFMEITSWTYSDAIEWVDAAGCGVLSDS